jgi:type IV pilus assembly protein PilQ
MSTRETLARDTTLASRGGVRLCALSVAIALAAGTATAVAQDAGLGGLMADEFVGSADPYDAVPMNGSENVDVPVDAAMGEDEDFNFDVTVNEYDLVDLHVNNEDLGRVLQLLSIQSERNIVASKDVKASITADLYGVTFYEALDAILHVNGYGYIERGNFIYVYSREELLSLEKAAQKRESRVLKLDYLNSTDAAEFAKQLLSDGGAITTSAAADTFSISDSPSGAEDFADTSTIVVFDYAENIEAIASLLKEIDTKPVQVLVEATILQTTLNEANAFGVDFTILNNMDFTDFVGLGGPLNAISGLLGGQGETVDGTAVPVPASGNGSAVTSTVGNVDAGRATLKAGIVNEDVAVFLRLLDEVTDVTVVSNPKILTLNRQPARVLVGTKVGYLNTTTTETSTTQTVEFLDTGTQLAVRPFVSANGLIRLELRPQVSSAQLREITDSTGNTVTIPDEDTTELTTNVMLRDGQTAVLGGLFTETTTVSRRQVPLLGDIPVIGQAFRGNDDSTRRSEIIFMITPSIVNDTMADEHGREAERYMENARVGARAGTLAFSRERRVGQLLIEARRLADEGKVDEAVFKIKRALRLSPNSPDARVLLEEVTGKTKRVPSRSMLDGVLYGELHGGPGAAPAPARPTDQPTPSTYVEPISQGDANGSAGFASNAPTAAEFPQASSNDDAWANFYSSSADEQAGGSAEFVGELPENDTFEPAPQPAATFGSAIVVETIGGSGGFAAAEPFQSQPSAAQTFPQVRQSDSFEPTPVSLQTETTAQPGTTDWGTTPATQPGTVGSATTNDAWQIQPNAHKSAQARSQQVSQRIENGNLMVPLPGGGTLQVPWPQGDQLNTPANSAFATAPTDSE